MDLLEKEIKDNGNIILSNSQIDDFIRRNCLDKDWNILRFDVRLDMYSILIRLKKSLGNEKHNKTNTMISNHTKAKRKKVASYNEYIKLLENEVRLANGGRLTSEEINEFICKNELKSDWNINYEDVNEDLNTIYKKESEYQNVNSNDDTNSIKNEKSNTRGLHENQTISMLDKMSSDDLKIAEMIHESLVRYPDIGEDAKRWRFILTDVLIKRNLEINLLSILVEEGIIKAIDQADTIEIIHGRFVDMLNSDYGIDSSVACRMVQIWIYGYGILYLKKSYNSL